jgi:hypothetical protein
VFDVALVVLARAHRSPQARGMARATEPDASKLCDPGPDRLCANAQLRRIGRIRRCGLEHVTTTTAAIAAGFVAGLAGARV